MFQIPERLTKKKASILIHLQNHHSEDKTFLFVFPELQDPFIFFIFMLVK